MLCAFTPMKNPVLCNEVIMMYYYFQCFDHTIHSQKTTEHQ
jgi:hypothetical protein